MFNPSKGLQGYRGSVRNGALPVHSLTCQTLLPPIPSHGRADFMRRDCQRKGPVSETATKQGLRQVTETVQGLKQVTGTVQGLRQVTGTVQGLRQVTGTVQGLRQVTGTVQGLRQVTGTVQGLKQVTGTVQGLRQVTGTVQGLRQVTGTVQGLGQVTGTVQGLGQVTGTIGGWGVKTSDYRTVQYRAEGSTKARNTSYMMVSFPSLLIGHVEDKCTHQTVIQFNTQGSTYSKTVTLRALATSRLNKLSWVAVRFLS